MLLSDKNVFSAEWLLIISSIAFGLLTAFVTHTADLPWLALAPLALIPILLFVLKPTYFWFLIVGLTPLSLSLEETGLGGIGFYMPTEPMLLVFTLFFILKLIVDNPIPRHIWRHPVTILLVVQIIWLCLCCTFSTLPIVSIKFVISRLWFVIPIYLGGTIILNSTSRQETFFKSYLGPFVLVATYTLIRHYGFNFEERPAHWVMRPFLKDHTQLGAVYGLVFPIVGYLIYTSKTTISRLIYIAIALLFSYGLYYTYSRAALLSLVIALGVLVIILLKIPFKSLIAIASLALVIVGLTFNSIIQSLEVNETDSSDNFAENLESVTNISTDASNVERLNRWLSAIDMFKERPIFGWGPGVYKFEYAPFQRAQYQTIISTNEGRVGNAHSEYLGPLAETGLIGMALTVLIFGFILLAGIRTFSQLTSQTEKGILLVCTLGLITYMSHGLLNNFLDTDKASVLFWGYAAIIIHYDSIRRQELRRQQ